MYACKISKGGREVETAVRSRRRWRAQVPDALGCLCDPSRQTSVACSILDERCATLVENKQLPPQAQEDLALWHSSGDLSDSICFRLFSFQTGAELRKSEQGCRASAATAELQRGR